AGAPFQYSPQPIEGTAVAAAASRSASGDVTAYLSVAPLVSGREVAGTPPGDGDLIRETADGGWQDLSLSQYPGAGSLPGDAPVKTDPVLALPAGPGGGGGWARGGGAGPAAPRR